MTLQEQFGQIDIYLFDQILRGNVLPGMRVLDAGCGGGRNIQYLLREGYEVFGVDVNAEAVAAVRKMASELAPGRPAENFQVASVVAMPFADEFADVVVYHSVLHFARDEAQLEAMVRGLWRVLRPGRMLFCRLPLPLPDAPLAHRFTADELSRLSTQTIQADNPFVDEDPFDSRYWEMNSQTLEEFLTKE